MKNKFILLLIIFSLLKIDFGFSQNNSIKGKVVSSISLKKPNVEIYIIEKGTTNGTLADSLGFFTLIPLKEKNNYSLEISVGSYDKLEYEYESEWTNWKKPKSIVVSGKCEINREKAKLDWKNGVAKLYLFGGIVPIGYSKKDDKFERKYKVKYQDFGCDTEIYECISEYNEYIFNILDIKFGEKMRKMIRKDIVGFKDFENNQRACID
jgi:hypothetical protein